MVAKRKTDFSALLPQLLTFLQFQQEIKSWKFAVYKGRPYTGLILYCHHNQYFRICAIYFSILLPIKSVC